MSKKKTDLNESQYKAITHEKGPLLVVAGAGTGKTRVITERIKSLIMEHDIKPKEILALTFTEKAANEMVERIGDVMPLGYEEPWVCTFHNFADRILKLEGLEIGLDPSYKILGYPDQWLLLRKNIFKLDLEYFRPLGNPTKFISAILKFISRLQDENISPENFKEFANNFKGDETEGKRWKELAHVYEKYQQLKMEKSRMDFGDLITWVIKLFKERPNILKKYQTEFKHVLVDEFQDTNYAQYELIKMLCPQELGERSLLVVGDDSQSIYKFRGAAISNILQFMEDYPAAEMVTLLENYRSTQEILDPSYKLIQNNNPDTLESKLGISKELVSKVSEAGIKPEILKMENVEAEVEQVVAKIYEILAKEPDYSYKDFAILARANNHLDAFMLALRRYGLPYQLVGNRGLYDRDEIRDILAVLRILLNPKDEISLYRALNITSLKIPHETIADLLSQARLNKTALWDLIKESYDNNIRFFYEQIQGFQEKTTKLTPSDFVYQLVYSIKYLDQFIENENMENQLCIKNLDIFLKKIKEFEASFYGDTKQIPTILNLVDHLDLMIEAGENPAQAEIEDIDTINLMTVHASKGLEFPVVFVVNLVADRFPTRNKKDIIQLPDEVVKEFLPTGDEHIQEERRLFYVAITRAKKYLYLTLAKDYGGKREKTPSGYLNELGLKIQDVTNVKISEPENQESLFGMQSGFRDISKMPTKPNAMESWSFSKIDTYETCPLKYKYRYVLQIPGPPNPALSFGEAIHETLFEYHTKKSFGKELSLEEFLQLYKNKWRPLGYLDENHQNIRFESGKKLLENYYNKHHAEKIKHEALEKWFNIKINGYSFRGKIDRIDRLPEGGVEIIDYKTGEVKPQADIDKDSQVTLYSMGAKEALGLDVKKLSYYYVEKGEKITTTRTERDIENKKQEVTELITKIKKANFEPKSGMHCDWCEYQGICPFANK